MEAIFKQLSDFLKNNKNLIISLDIPKNPIEQGQILEAINQFHKRLTLDQRNSIIFTTTKDVPQGLLAMYQNKGVNIVHNAINKIVVSIGPGGKAILGRESKRPTKPQQYRTYRIKQYRTDPAGLVKLLKQYPALIKQFQDMPAKFGATFAVYPKPWWFYSIQPNTAALVQLAAWGIPLEIKIDNVPPIDKLSANSSWEDIMKSASGAAPFQNLWKSRSTGISLPPDPGNIIVTNVGLRVIGSTWRAGLMHCSQPWSQLLTIVGYFTSYLSYLALANIFSPTEIGVVSALVSPCLPFLLTRTAHWAGIQDHPVCSPCAVRMLTNVLFTLGFFSNGYLSWSDNAKAVGCTLASMIAVETVMQGIQHARQLSSILSSAGSSFSSTITRWYHRYTATTTKAVDRSEHTEIELDQV